MKYLINTNNIKLYIESIIHIGSIYRILRFESRDIKESYLLYKDTDIDKIITNINNSVSYQILKSIPNTQYSKDKYILLNKVGDVYNSPLEIVSFNKDKIKRVY